MEPTTFLDRIVGQWHESMGPGIEVEFSHAIRRLASCVPEGKIHRWSLFAGSGISSKAIKLEYALIT
jgi:hypothetical protein